VYGDSSAHAWVDRNKLSVELNLKNESGTAIFHELAEEADIVVQNSSPGVVERLGVGYDDIRQTTEDVIYLNISGYGRDGPYSDRKAYDMVMQGETGLIPMNGSPDAPAKIPLSVCDINAATYGTISALLALFHRERTGEGQELDVTMFGGMLSWLGYFPHKYWHNDELPERIGMRHHLLTPTDRTRRPTSSTSTTPSSARRTGNCSARASSSVPTCSKTSGSQTTNAGSRTATFSNR